MAARRAQPAAGKGWPAQQTKASGPGDQARRTLTCNTGLRNSGRAPPTVLSTNVSKTATTAGTALSSMMPSNDQRVEAHATADKDEQTSGYTIMSTDMPGIGHQTILSQSTFILTRARSQRRCVGRFLQSYYARLDSLPNAARTLFALPSAI